MKALFIGFGNVGRKIASILARERERFPNLKDLAIEPVGIVTRSKGSLADPEGLDFNEALSMMEELGRFDPDSPACSKLESLEAAECLDYDVLVELSTLSIEKNGEPATSHIRTALSRGKHAVSANKGPVAFSYSEIAGLAREKGCRFLHETIVMDGAPVFNLARCTLKGCIVTGVEGIFNSTTNFVLTQMEQGVSLEDAVREAQRVGVAEADPSHDLEGWDAAAKTAALANVLMNAGITPFDVARTGISGVTQEEVAKAVAKGGHLKLICRAKPEGGSVRATVGVEEVEGRHYYAAVSGRGAVLRIETDLMGPIFVTQEDPTLYDTAYGVLDDLLTLQRPIS
ncbi:MAG: homoserine dehydrogenase [Thermovirgaceae bacterium]